MRGIAGLKADVWWGIKSAVGFSGVYSIYAFFFTLVVAQLYSQSKGSYSVRH
jgi:hypothetical protein